MKRKYYVILLVLTSLIIGKYHEAKAQHVAIKTNALAYTIVTPNLGFEVKISEQWSASLHGEYNPFSFGKWKDAEGNLTTPNTQFFMLMPEAKYWFSHTFSQHYVGLHGLFGTFNVGGLNSFIPRLKRFRYQGSFYGGGISYGYQLPLSEKWGVDFTLGVGYLRFYHKRYQARDKGDFLNEAYHNYFGITKLGITFSYYI